MKETREQVLKFHSILRRFDNLVDQVKMCAKNGDDSLYDMYFKQKKFLEKCDVVISVGTKDNNVAAIATWLDASDRLQGTEYFCERYGHKQDDDNTFKVRAGIILALQAWGPSKLADYKVALVTTDDEIGKWLRQLSKTEEEEPPKRDKDRRDKHNDKHYEVELDAKSKAKQDLDDWLDSHNDENDSGGGGHQQDDPDLDKVKKLWGEHNIQLTTFATSRHSALELVCEVKDSSKAEEKLENVVNSNLMGSKVKRIRLDKDGRRSDGRDGGGSGRRPESREKRSGSRDGGRRSDSREGGRRADSRDGGRRSGSRDGSRRDRE